jgi:hypothetical protein
MAEYRVKEWTHLLRSAKARNPPMKLTSNHPAKKSIPHGAVMKLLMFKETVSLAERPSSGRPRILE